MKSKNILFVFEGEVEEVEFFKTIINEYYEIYYKDIYMYSYSASIYELYDQLKKDSYLTITGLLLEREKDSKVRVELKKEYSEIYLVFDFDPHYQKYGESKIKSMLHLMDDELDDSKGKLYLNYPMVESYKHFSHFPDPNYKECYVYLCDCANYKKEVNTFTILHKKTDLKFNTINEIIKHNLRKTNYILNNNYDDLSYNEYINFDFNEVLNIQINLLNKLDKIFVLNTSIFILLDFLHNDKLFKLIYRG